ncbi:HopJ type III effector protein [Methylosarcina fibrata]|uniref:HopJ type III effector protein n=1 Tax=Methylosarcina fibrata TaxID=105972 RepID=UPI00036591D1|nr:HopJ type III effector protein [Methylosarcina fibrata]
MSSLHAFLNKIKHNETVSFDETIAVIAEHYHYTPTEFSNGLGEQRLVNPAGVNEGSCKLFAFARLHRLDPLHTLNLFGDYYRIDVLNDPEGTGHQNIRHFMKFGWEGIRFSGEPLAEK